MPQLNFECLNKIHNRVVTYGRISTEPVRWLLIVSSSLWAIMLWNMPYIMQEKELYRIMKLIMHQDIWMIAFALHSALAYFSLQIRGTLADSIVQTYGSILWVLSAWSMIFAEPAPSLSGEIIISLASIWVTIRSFTFLRM